MLSPRVVAWNAFGSALARAIADYADEKSVRPLMNELGAV